MSGVYIKGMNMPEKCWDCKLCAFIPIGDDGLMTKCLPLNRATDAEKLRPDCPLVSVPDHDRLIDAKSISEKIDNIWDGRPLSTLGCEILAMIEKEPTVIEADI